jgi:hypothetical protein
MCRLSGLLALLLCATVSAAPADGPYWFVIASFELRETAERFVAESGSQITGPVEILPAIGTDGRDRYRVATGPYESLQEANARTARLLDAFPDGWVVSAPFPAIGYPPPESATREPATESPPARKLLPVPQRSDTRFNRLHREPGPRGP